MHPQRTIQIWLILGCVLITCMVAIGGITRLTGSGLSITEWDLILGALPPMGEADWDEAFNKYKQIPEYALKNRHMQLPEFKSIYFWEYLHRNWGRMMGLVFILPFLHFLRKGWIKGWLLKRSLLIMLSGGAVGALGWFMVKSGLVDRPDVSHYRLAIHLCAAFMVLTLVLWTTLDLKYDRRSLRSDGSPLGRMTRWVLVLVLVQIVWGAFTAGLDAGRIYNTWPLMNGSFMPDNLLAHQDLLKDLTDHRDGVQFVHRNLAWIVIAACIGLAIHYRKASSMATHWRMLMLVVSLQFVLGVITVVLQVPIWAGVMHQLGAVLLLCVLVMVAHRSGKLINAT